MSTNKRSIALLIAIISSLPLSSYATSESSSTPWEKRVQQAKSELLTKISQLSPEAQKKALKTLKTLPESNYATTQVDPEGRIFAVDPGIILGSKSYDMPLPVLTPQSLQRVDTSADEFYLHSKPSAKNIIYLDFAGEHLYDNWIVPKDQYPTGRVAYPASIDSDPLTYNEEELKHIRYIWTIVADLYSPFDVDVTTEEPPHISDANSNIAHHLITPNQALDGQPIYNSQASGVAVIGGFGSRQAMPSLSFYFGGGYQSYSDEVVAHELGHLFGLTHDGTTDGDEYYSGHGIGNTSWAPIMGSAFYTAVQQWSDGSYPKANNSQDDIKVVSDNLEIRSDDHESDFSFATPLLVGADGSVLSTTLYDDPDNGYPANKGIIEEVSDVDTFKFHIPEGDTPTSVHLRIESYRDALLRTESPRKAQTSSDVTAKLYSGGDTVTPISESQWSNNQTATIISNLDKAGDYYLTIQASADTNYPSYGSLGNYSITGSIASASYQKVKVADDFLGYPQFVLTLQDRVGGDNLLLSPEEAEALCISEGLTLGELEEYKTQEMVDFQNKYASLGSQVGYVDANPTAVKVNSTHHEDYMEYESRGEVVVCKAAPPVVPLPEPEPEPEPEPSPLPDSDSGSGGSLNFVYMALLLIGVGRRVLNQCKDSETI